MLLVSTREDQRIVDPFVLHVVLPGGRPRRPPRSNNCPAAAAAGRIRSARARRRPRQARVGASCVRKERVVAEDVLPEAVADQKADDRARQRLDRLDVDGYRHRLAADRPRQAFAVRMLEAHVGDARAAPAERRRRRVELEDPDVGAMAACLEHVEALVARRRADIAVARHGCARRAISRDSRLARPRAGSRDRVRTPAWTAPWP